MTVESGRKRSIEQNSLSHKWYQEIADQRGDTTPSEVKAECKLMFGVPILREENEKFRETYDRVLKPFSYEQKVEFILRTELPITSLMNVKQLTRYLDDLHLFWAKRGIILTQPDAAPSLVEVDAGGTGVQPHTNASVPS